MIEVARHDGSYLDICKYYRAMFDTPSVLEDKAQKHEVRMENDISVSLSFCYYLRIIRLKGPNFQFLFKYMYK